MIMLPPLDGATRIRLRREGGVAYVAALARVRDIDLQACDPARRQALCEALGEAAARAGPLAGGDRRYYRVEILFGGRTGDIAFDIAETSLPALLAEAWKQAQAGRAV
ncbi:protealysin inhibitor emfourin [Bordetella genomosp. 13]|uniref:protealysin inhibitor emfourin n=1 Tax=Bordetella genomosp. 13 TaxID=463040 RepID=UPI0011A87563|nr:protealysin inhibitor emfourin [Bordetella genomosp. 13]